MLTSIELVTSTLAQAPGIARNGDDGDYNSDYYSWTPTTIRSVGSTTSVLVATAVAEYQYQTPFLTVSST